MADPTYPTRKALEAFCPDKRTVRAFELLFEKVNNNSDSILTNATNISTNTTAIADHETRIDALENP